MSTDQYMIYLSEHDIQRIIEALEGQERITQHAAETNNNYRHARILVQDAKADRDLIRQLQSKIKKLPQNRINYEKIPNY